MMRRVTCACMLMAGLSGLYLYQVKHRAQLLDRQIAEVVSQTDTARERTRLLRAEWALLNEPERLQQLSEHFLQLRPMAPNQFVRMAELGEHLPAVQSAPSTPAEPDTVQAEDDEGTAPTPAVPPLPKVVTAITSHPPLPTVQFPAAHTHPDRMVAQPERIASHTPLRVEAANHRAADRLPDPVRHDVTTAAIRPAAPMVAAAAVPTALAFPRPRVQTIEAMQPVRAVPAVGYGSALGMARMILPPPVPVAPPSMR